MKIFHLYIFFLLILPLNSFASNPSLAKYSNDYKNIFWFAIVADTHIGEGVSGGSQDSDNLIWLTSEFYNIVEPAFIAIAGDITDSTNGGLIPDGPHEKEWKEYENILYFNKMTSEIFFDVPGNHDHYNDKEFKFYKKFSIQGKATNSTQQSWIIEKQNNKYHFVSVSTPANDGMAWPFDNAGLDNEELKFLEDELKKFFDARLTFVIGHHPLLSLFYGKKEFIDILKKNKVSSYIYGHTHKFSAKYKDGILFFNIASLGKSKEKNVGIVAIDNDSVIARGFNVQDYPYIIITAPADYSFGGGNPFAYPASGGWKENPARALVFSDKPIEKVEFKIDDGKWILMNEIEKKIYSAMLDGTNYEKGVHNMIVRAVSNGVEKSHKITITIEEVLCSNGKDDDGDGLVDFPFDDGCLTPWDNDEWGDGKVEEVLEELTLEFFEIKEEIALSEEISDFAKEELFTVEEKYKSEIFDTTIEDVSGDTIYITAPAPEGCGCKINKKDSISPVIFIFLYLYLILWNRKKRIF